MICADSCDGITKYYTSNTVYACMEEQTEDQLTAYRRLIGHEADLVTTEDAVDINRLREKAAVLERERDKLRRELDYVYGMIRDVKADHALLEGKWATAKETYEKQIREQAETIDSALEDIDALRVCNNELTAHVRDLEVDHAMSETVRATMEAEDKKAIDELKAQVADKDNAIKLLQGMLADRAWEHASKRLDIGSVEENVKLKKANEDLEKKCKDLGLTVEKITETNAKMAAGMSNTIADLKEKNRNLHSRIEGLESDAKALRRRTCEDGRDKHLQRLTIRELKKQIDQLQGTVAKTKEQLNKSLEQRARLQSYAEELFRENTSLRGKLACFESPRP